MGCGGSKQMKIVADRSVSLELELLKAKAQAAEAENERLKLELRLKEVETFDKIRISHAAGHRTGHLADTIHELPEEMHHSGKKMGGGGFEGPSAESRHLTDASLVFMGESPEHSCIGSPDIGRQSNENDDKVREDRVDTKIKNLKDLRGAIPSSLGKQKGGRGRQPPRRPLLGNIDETKDIQPHIAYSDTGSMSTGMSRRSSTPDESGQNIGSLKRLLKANKLLNPGWKVCEDLGISSPADFYLLTDELLKALDWLTVIPRIKIMQVVESGAPKHIMLNKVPSMDMAPKPVEAEDQEQEKPIIFTTVALFVQGKRWKGVPLPDLSASANLPCKSSALQELEGHFSKSHPCYEEVRESDTVISVCVVWDTSKLKPRPTFDSQRQRRSIRLSKPFQRTRSSNPFRDEPVLCRSPSPIVEVDKVLPKVCRKPVPVWRAWNSDKRFVKLPSGCGSISLKIEDREVSMSVHTPLEIQGKWAVYVERFGTTRPSYAKYTCSKCSSVYPASKFTTKQLQRQMRALSKREANSITCNACRDRRAKQLRVLQNMEQGVAAPKFNLRKLESVESIRSMLLGSGLNFEDGPDFSANAGEEPCSGIVPIHPPSSPGELCERRVRALKMRLKTHRTVSVFLSSPFQGLLFERAKLVEKYGPSLKKKCEERGCSFLFIDLRWGITQSMTAEHRTVRTCLEAIDQSDLFLGFFAQRYGASMLDPRVWDWMGPAIKCCADVFPWVQDLPPFTESATGKVTARSVTDLEFQHGLLREPTKWEGGGKGPVFSFCFFRDQALDTFISKRWPDEAWKYQAEGDTSAKALEQLKAEVGESARQGHTKAYIYNRPEDFAEQTYNDMLSVLDACLPVAMVTDDFEHESFSYVATACHAGMDGYTDEMRKFVNSRATVPLVVTGNSGSGKSGLLAKIAREFASEGSGTCIMHFVGLSSTSKKLATLLERLVRGLDPGNMTSEQDDSLPPNAEEPTLMMSRWIRQVTKRILDSKLDMQLPSAIQWCCKPSSQRVLIVIDALNELEVDQYRPGTSPHDLQWLNVAKGQWQRFPSNVKVVVSTLRRCAMYPTGRTYRVLEDRGIFKEVPPIVLKPLDKQQCNDIMQSFLKQCHKQLDPKYQLENFLATSEGHANPLFVTLFMQEMIMFSGYEISRGVYEQLDEHVANLCKASNVPELLQLMLQRLERVHLLPQSKTEIQIGRAMEASEDGDCLKMTLQMTEGSCRCNCGDILQVRFQDEEVCEFHVLQLLPGNSLLLRRGENLVARAAQMAGAAITVRRLSLISTVLQFVSLSSEGLSVPDLLALVNRLYARRGYSFCEGGEEEGGRVEQRHLLPVLFSLHRLLQTSSGGLISCSHEHVRRAVERRYFALGQDSVSEIKRLSERKLQVDYVKELHKLLAEYFKELCEEDQGSELMEQLPRSYRAKQHHELKAGILPSFLVAARCRPFIEREVDDGIAPLQLRMTSKQVRVVSPLNHEATAFTLDACVSQLEAQDDVFRRIGAAALMDQVVEGFNCTIMTYGQTGSGKTFSMFGEPNEGDEGVIPRSIRTLLAALERKKAEDGRKVQVRCAVLEIYNEQVRDLLTVPPAVVRLMDDSHRGVVLLGRSAKEVKTADNALAVVAEAYTHRETRATSMNLQSSRSHCVVTFSVNQELQDLEGEAVVLQSEVHFVDLAGSERGRTRYEVFWVPKGGQNASRGAKNWAKAKKKVISEHAWDNVEIRQTQKEATMINCSLSALHRVILSLAAENQRHIPYRESKLTRILQNSLGGNSLTVLLVTLSPSIKDFSETMSTLSFARRAKHVQNHAARNAENRLVADEVSEDLHTALEAAQMCLGQGSVASSSAVDDDDDKIMKDILECPEGGEVCLPSGTYDVERLLELNKTITISAATDCKEGDVTLISSSMEGIFKITGGTVTMRNLSLSMLDGTTGLPWDKGCACVAVHSGTVVLEGCRVFCMMGTGVYVNAGGTVKGSFCTLSRCGCMGLCCTGGSTARMSSCALSANGRTGMWAGGAGTAASLTSCTVRDNGANGVELSRGACGDVAKTTCSGNRAHGISVHGKGAKLKVVTCVLEENRGTGIFVDDSASLTAQGCAVGCCSIGVSVEQAASFMLVTECTMCSNAVGARAAKGAVLEMVACLVKNSSEVDTREESGGVVNDEQPRSSEHHDSAASSSSGDESDGDPFNNFFSK